MKKHLEKIISALTVAVILLSTLPISASAAVDGTFYFEIYNTDTSWITDSEARSAYESLEFYYLAAMGGEGGYVEETFISNIELNVAYGGDFSYSIKIVNNSIYEFKFEITAFYVGTYGPFTIPAATSEGPGEYYYTIDSSLLSNSEFQRLRFDFSEYQPVCCNSYNDNAAAINFYTPDGFHSSQLVYAPSETIGVYTYDFDDLLADGLIELPDALEGYLLDSSTVPEVVTVNPDVVIEYDIYYVDKINSGFISFYAQLPDGQVVPLGQVKPPENHVGAYTFVYSDVMRSFVLEDYAVEALEGYEINYSLFDINTSYTIYTDTGDEIFIPYQVAESSARTLRFELYDVYGTFLEAKIVKVANSALTCNTPIYGEYDTFPYSVDVDLTKPLDEVQVFMCYVVDVSGVMNDSYDRGYKDGLAFGQASAPDAGAAWQEGYDEGLADGLKQNKLTAEQIQHYTKDYNAITAFFDGLFGWMKNMFFDLGNGIQYKGVKAIDIVSSVIIISVVIWGYKTIF